MKRRTLLIGAAIGLGQAGLWRRAPAADDTLAPLPADNPSAQALKYVEDAADAAAAIYPKQGNPSCADCAHFTAGGDGRGACALFPGFSVAATGWCSGWVAA